jgi:DNA replication and repair protein RecF
VEILSLTSDAFRNLASTRLEFHPRLNLVVGDNGQGKTNLLEALALVSGRASFRTRDLAEVREHLSPRTDATLGLVLAAGVREHYRDGKRVTRLAAARALPAVFLTSRDLARLSGPAADRRRALDRAALAVDPEHARTLAQYEKARASKTRLLALSPRYDADEMSVYESTLAETGARIAVSRRATRARLEAEIARAAEALGSPFRGVALELVSDLPAEGDAADLSRALAVLMREKKADERRAQRCLAGPHRDDVVLKAEGVPVAARASSGETRTFLLAWTLAEMTLMAEAAGNPPVLAFDDFDSEWDPRVLAAFAEALPEDGQIFLSSARPEAVRGLPLPPGALYRMAAGRLAREGILGAGRSATRVARGGSR